MIRLKWYPPFHTICVRLLVSLNFVNNTSAGDDDSCIPLKFLLFENEGKGFTGRYDCGFIYFQTCINIFYFIIDI